MIQKQNAPKNNQHALAPNSQQPFPAKLEELTEDELMAISGGAGKIWEKS